MARTFSELPRLWYLMKEISSVSSSRTLTVANSDLGVEGQIFIADAVDVLAIQWAWFEDSEFKHFYFFPDFSSVYLCARDRAELHFFYGSPPHGRFLLETANPNVFSLKLPELRIDDIRAPQASTNSNLLIPVQPFNDYSSTHFGHFVIEQLPLMLVADCLGARLLVSRSLTSWAQQLLDLANLKHLQHNIYPFKDSRIARADLGRATIQSKYLRARFIKLERKLSASLLKAIASQPCPIRSSSNPIRVAVLSRLKMHKHQRWTNENELYKPELKHQYQQLFPEKLGVMGLRTHLHSSCASVVVSAIGSACYQLFLDKKRRYEVILLFGDFNLSRPSQWFSTYLPFKHLFWMLLRSVNYHPKWNMPFQVSPDLIDVAVEIVLQQEDVENPIFLQDGFTLLPPRFDLKLDLPFGVDFS